MKLDADIIRKIILTVEGSTEWVTEVEDVSADEFAYHVKQLIDGGLLTGTTLPNEPSNIPADAIAKDLTYEGHEFAKAMINDNLWNKAKEHIIKPSASWTVGIMIEYLKLQLRQLAGLDQ